MAFTNKGDFSQAQTRRQESSAALMALKSKRGNQDRIIQARTDRRTSLLSFAQQRLWFLNELMGDNPLYNVPAPISIRGQLDADLLKRSLNEVVGRHEILRTTFSRQEGDPVQVVAGEMDLPLLINDVS